jgi:hypothetical protein
MECRERYPAQTLHDVTVVTKKTYARAHVLGVPPKSSASSAAPGPSGLQLLLPQGC